MRMSLPAFAVTALVGFGGPADAQMPCPELIRLRSEAAAVAKRTIGVPIMASCERYARLATAWNAVAQYAIDHREVCEISDRTIDDFEKYQREASAGRDNVCAGRPARPFPPEIIRR